MGHFISVICCSNAQIKCKFGMIVQPRDSELRQVLWGMRNQWVPWATHTGYQHVPSLARAATGMCWLVRWGEHLSALNCVHPHSGCLRTPLSTVINSDSPLLEPLVEWDFSASSHLILRAGRNSYTLLIWWANGSLILLRNLPKLG